jgi:hypothetical protein
MRIRLLAALLVTASVPAAEKTTSATTKPGLPSAATEATPGLKVRET